MAGVCRYCGASQVEGARFCIMCGAPLMTENSRQNSAVSNDMGVYQRDEAPVYSENTVAFDRANAENTYNVNAQPPKPVPERKFDPAALVLAVINFVMGFSIVGALFGGAGIYIAYKAKNALLDEDHATYNKISVIIGIVGIVLSVLVIVAAAVKLN